MRSNVVKVQVRLHPVPAQGRVVEKKSGRGAVRVVRIAAVGDAAHEEDLGAGPTLMNEIDGTFAA